MEINMVNFYQNTVAYDDEKDGEKYLVSFTFKNVVCWLIERKNAHTLCKTFLKRSAF